jgi:hypothetical protein
MAAVLIVKVLSLEVREKCGKIDFETVLGPAASSKLGRTLCTFISPIFQSAFLSDA